jgi:hypothetical protein
MRRRLAAAAVTGMVLAITAAGPASARPNAAPAKPAAQAGILTTYGPYGTEGECNYWRYGVAAGGTAVSECWYWRGWWFQTL